MLDLTVYRQPSTGMENTLDKAYKAIVYRTLNRKQWLNIYSAYRCAIRTYNGNNNAERLMAECLLSHELGEYIQDMRHVQRRTGRMRRIAQLRRKIRVRLHHAATS